MLTDLIIDGHNGKKTLRIKGRVQFLSLKRVWHFFPEAPSGDNGLLGFSKECSNQDPRVLEVIRRFEANRDIARFYPLDEVVYWLGHKREIIYDDDGLYLRWPSPDGDQVLMGRYDPYSLIKSLLRI
jgi:hypothetical protein